MTLGLRGYLGWLLFFRGMYILLAIAVDFGGHSCILFGCSWPMYYMLCFYYDFLGEGWVIISFLVTPFHHLHCLFLIGPKALIDSLNSLARSMPMGPSPTPRSFGGVTVCSDPALEGGLQGWTACNLLTPSRSIQFRAAAFCDRVSGRD